MKSTIIIYQGQKYTVLGCNRAGFEVYKDKIYLGRSVVVDTAKQAVIETIRNQYSRFY